MSKLAWIATLAILTTTTAATAQTAVPDMPAPGKAIVNSMIIGAGNPHHALRRHPVLG